MSALFLIVLAIALPSRAGALPDPVGFAVAIERGDLAQAREWLDGGLAPDFEGAVIGSGLMIGAWEGNIAMMELFLARGADIDLVNARGEQALLHAAWKGHLAAVRWLIERGAKLNRPGGAWSALHYAAFAGHDGVVAFLLERGAEIDALSPNGSTPLMMAAREGREGISGILLAAGARTDIVNERGDDALRWAMRYRHLTIARAISGAPAFAAAVEQPAASWGAPIHSLPSPDDEADRLLALARRMGAEGRREDALKLYRAALAAIRRADGTGPAPGATRATGLLITARRGAPSAQSASLDYATPAVTAVGDPPGGEDVAEEWLRRAREFDAAGRRKEALHAYRQAAGALRAATAPVARPAGPAAPPP